jgi:hypothetical protein
MSAEFCERNRQAQLLAWQRRGVTEEFREKMRQAQQASRKRNPNRALSPEALERMREVGSRRRGAKFSAESLARLSASKLGKKFTPEHRANLSAALKQTYADPNIRQKISERVSKRIMTPTGEFPSVIQAEIWATEHGLKNARGKIRLWLKTHPEQFYFIKKDTQ